MFAFLKSDRKLLGETVNYGLEPGLDYPKTKSISQNLKFQQTLRQFTFMNGKSAFLNSLSRHLG